MMRQFALILFLLPIALSSYGSNSQLPPPLKVIEPENLNVVVDDDITDKHWQIALNNKVAKGKIDAKIKSGRVDILTETYVIEVNSVSDWRQGLARVKRFAQETQKSPGLALYIDGDENGYQKFVEALKFCSNQDIAVWLINEYVTVNDLLEVELPLPKKKHKLYKKGGYWLDNSGIRHNKACPHYGNIANGRAATADEGEACPVCGG